MGSRFFVLLLISPLLLTACAGVDSAAPDISSSIVVADSETTSFTTTTVVGAVGEDVTITYTRDEANPGFTFWVVGNDSDVLSPVANVDDETSIPCVGTVTFEVLKPGVVRLGFADADKDGNIVGSTTFYEVVATP